MASTWVAQDRAASFFRASEPVRSKAIPYASALDWLASRCLGWPRSDAQFVDSEARPGEAKARQVKARPGWGQGPWLWLSASPWHGLPRPLKAAEKLNFQWLTSVVDTSKGCGGRAQRLHSLTCKFGGSAPRCMVFPVLLRLLPLLLQCRAKSHAKQNQAGAKQTRGKHKATPEQMQNKRTCTSKAHTKHMQSNNKANRAHAKQM